MTWKMFGHKCKTYWQGFMVRFNRADAANNAVVLAFYTLLAMFPAIIFVGNLLPLFHINVGTVLEYIETVVPSTIYQISQPIVKDFLEKGNGEVLSVGAILMLWSSSQAVSAFQRSINRAYGVAKFQNPIINRIGGFFFTIFLVGLIALMMFFFSFGQTIVSYLTPILKLPHSLFHIVGNVKLPSALIIIFLSLTILYYVVPNTRIRFGSVIWGSAAATIGLMGVSQFFTLYLRYFARSVNSYKTLGTFIALMFWLEFSALVIMIGGVINATNQELRYGDLEDTTKEWNQRLKRFWK
ncbi:YihY/virulence factor BrkB family protein [Pediococcus inopinatus]|uniref:YihY/virulence factor BrkB family protein n=1 Tax=Pediococcus TaxID=1253 RepID=UPI0007C4E205|nr:YihY/virulence factor BrkB family protein [Pediococcus inopinatus]WPC18214.1 YihY/virulence factor BrkB family protein [Pediococcus inopinatus]WPP08964.1 YihY/virulence factor BrkB family protein [Pediococcus inopinatus]